MSYPITKYLSSTSTLVERPEVRILVFKTSTELRNYPISNGSALNEGDLALRLGASAPFDVTLRWYSWDPNSTAADDGLTVMKPAGIDASNPGRWRSS